MGIGPVPCSVAIALSNRAATPAGTVKQGLGVVEMANAVLHSSNSETVLWKNLERSACPQS